MKPYNDTYLYSTQTDLSISIIPYDVLGRLRPQDIVVLGKILELINVDRSRNPGRTPRAWPGQKYLAKLAGVHRCTVSRSISRLRNKGLILGWQPRKPGGDWVTNRYYLSAKLIKWGVRAAARATKYTVDRVRTGAHKGLQIYNLLKKPLAVDIDLGLMTGNLKL